MGTTASGEQDYAYGVKTRKTGFDLNGDSVPDSTVSREFSSSALDKDRKYDIKYKSTEVTTSGEGETSSVAITALIKDSDTSTDLAFIFTDLNGNGVIDKGETAQLTDIKKRGDEGKVRDANSADLTAVLQDLNAQMERRKQSFQEEIKKKN